MTAPERIWARPDYNECWPKRLEEEDVEYIRADLAAVQPAQVRVKPLVWEEQDGKSYRQANCVFGQYQVSFLCEFECWQLSKPQKPEQAWRESFSIHSHKDAAKAAAQVDYETRIIAAIEPQPDPRDEVTDAARDVLAERARQISVELFHPRSDDAYQARDLASAAACYCFAAAGYLMAHDGEPPKWWPWAKSWWKPSKDAPRRDLVKAGALILAEIERLDRAALAAAKAVQHG